MSEQSLPAREPGHEALVPDDQRSAAAAAAGRPAAPAMADTAALSAAGVTERVPLEEDEWSQQREELPPRPRRRLLAPLPLALLAILIAACGFIAGVLVEKGQTSSSSSSASAATGGGAGLASRFAALRRAGGGTSGAAGASGAGGAGSAATAAGRTTGQVAFIQGSTLYVTTAEGNTVKVVTSPASSVNRTVKASVASIHPGETVAITGTPGSGGTVTAESVRVGENLEAGGLSSLFGGGGGASGEGGGSGAGSRGGASSGSTSRGTGGGAGGGAGGEPSLFGKG